MITNINFIQLLSLVYFSINKEENKLEFKNSNHLDFDQGEETLCYQIHYIKNTPTSSFFILTENENYGEAFMITLKTVKRIIEESDYDILHDLSNRLKGVDNLGNMEVFIENGCLADIGSLSKNFNVESKDAIYFWKIIAESEDDTETDIDEYDICDYVKAVNAAEQYANSELYKNDTILLYRCRVDEPLTLDENEIHWYSK